MSINLGFKNNGYSLDKFNTLDNKIIINTYNNSNAILINTELDANENSVINFKNKYTTGIINNKYNIYDIDNKKTICSASSNFECFVNIKVKDLINTTSNASVFTSNLYLNLKNTNDTFQINNNNNTTVFETNSNFTTINNIKIQDTLYVNKLKNYTGNSIEIINPILVGLTLDSVNTDQSITINNLFSKYYSTPTILINRFDNAQNIIDIGTCNINNNKINKQFIVNRYGMVGIGTYPDTPLTITNINNNSAVFKYSGKNIGDNVIINKYGNIGIGTSIPKGMIHINRQDDLREELVRKDPLIKLDINYNASNNIVSTCNFNEYINVSNFCYYLNKNIDRSIFNDTITSNINYNIYFINSNAYTRFNNITYDTCNISLFNNTTITNINKDIYKLNNKYIYPSTWYSYENTASFSYNYTDTITNNTYDIIDTIQNISYTSNTSNYIRTHYFNNEIVMMSNDLYNRSGYINNTNNPRYNASNFVLTKGYFSNLENLNFTITDIVNKKSSNYINNVYYNINMIVENINNEFIYTTQVPSYTYNPPYFIEMTSNNDFKASLSSSGTLSLGSLDKDNKYILHADGTCMLKRAELSDIYTLKNNINFNNINLSNINHIYATSNNIDKSYIDTAIISNVYIHNQLCSNLFTSNLIINNVSGEYIKMNSSNIHITTKVSIGKDNSSIDTSANSLFKIIVNEKITTDNNYFKQHKGIFVTNDINTDIIKNPSITILGYDNSTPYINISRRNRNNTLSDYYLRINNKTFNNNITENTDVFEICCDNLSNDTNRINYYNSVAEQPSFINHIKKYNLLTIGENNNVCVQCTNNLSTQNSFTSVNLSTYTNGTNKICMGFPYGIIEENSLTIKDWAQYFNNVIGNINEPSNRYAPYMLNVFGNMSVSSIYGKSMITIKTDNGLSRSKINETVNIIIGSTGDTTANVTINGGLYYTGALTTPSDSNIKRDITLIDNALEKINKISGYTYTNIHTSNRDTGLIAQEVIKILPEVVYNNPTTELLSISYANMMGIMVECIKELDNKLEKINNRLINIENRLSI